MAREDFVWGDFVRGDFGSGGYCPRGILSGGILSGGILTRGILSRGILSCHRNSHLPSLPYTLITPLLHSSYLVLCVYGGLLDAHKS